MKKICGVGLGVLCVAWLAGAETISITGITPSKAGTNLVATVSNSGKIFTSRSGGFPLNESTVASDYYGLTVTNLTVEGISGVTLTFDLHLSVEVNSKVTGLAVRSSNNNTFAYWVDCNGPGSGFNRYFNQGAVLTFAVRNVTVDKGLVASAVSFRPEQPWGLYVNSYIDVVSSNTSLAPTSWNPATGVLTACAGASSSEGAAVFKLGIDFTIERAKSLRLVVIRSE